MGTQPNGIPAAILQQVNPALAAEAELARAAAARYRCEFVDLRWSFRLVNIHWSVQGL